ncbi:MAG: endo alpha-1,4 polygalactosaminidase [Campylobacterota bacterium]|nr:endo alpha-1,4 polygalactosaminidase [Campylobacterota bacterium]
MSLFKKKILWFASIIYTSLFASTEKNAAVFYGTDLHYEKVKQSDYIIVQSNHIDTRSVDFLANKEKMYAYVSVGEISKDVKEYKKVKKEWIIAKNNEWDSEVLDIKNSEYRDFLFDEMIDPIIKSGFKHIFFDTLDSYQLACKTDKERKAYEEKLVLFINEFPIRYPKSKLIINRGFEVMDEVYKSVEAVLFESYYFGLGSGENRYRKISDGDREWLHLHIDKIKDYRLDVIAVDYLDENEMHKADEAIKIIRENGMIPYVSNRSLNIHGRGD